MSTPPASVPEALRAPEGTSGTTDHIWILVAVYALQSFAPLLYLASFDIGAFLRFEFDPSRPFSMFGLVFTPGAFATVAVTLLCVPALIVLSYADYKALTDRGVPSPFHWLTSLVPSYGPLIYVIGRSVVVYRRTGAGLAPLWVFIAVNVVAIIVSIVVAVVLLADTVFQVAQLPSSY